MKVSTILLSAATVFGVTQAQSNGTNNTSNNAAVPMGSSNNALNAGIVGAAVAGVAAFLL